MGNIGLDHSYLQSFTELQNKDQRIYVFSGLFSIQLYYRFHIGKRIKVKLLRILRTFYLVVHDVEEHLKVFESVEVTAFSEADLDFVL